MMDYSSFPLLGSNDTYKATASVSAIAFLRLTPAVCMYIMMLVLLVSRGFFAKQLAIYG